MNPGDIFTCTRCGDCCRGYGGTVVSETDIAAIAAHTKTDIDLFRKTCCLRSGNTFILAQRDDGYCIFWDRVCTIHAVKPKMCRAWPYLKAVLIDPDNWRIMAGLCLGIDENAPDRMVKAVIAKEIKKREERG